MDGQRAAPGPGGRARRILLVSPDDHLELDLRMTTAGLGPVAVARARNVTDAADQLDDHPVDVILADLAGVDRAAAARVVEHLVNLHEGAAVLVVLDHRDRELAAAMVSCGARDVVVRAELTGDRLAQELRVAGLRARSTDALEAALRGLERRNSELDQFACSLGHDLRSPIRTARALTQLADRRRESPEDLRDVLGRIEQALDRLDTRVSALVRLARVGGAAVRRRRCRLDDLVERVRADMAADLATSDATLRLGTDPIDLAVDPDLFAEVLQNLIANSLTYARPQVAPVVEIGSERVGHGVVVTVTDNGTGIAPHARHRALQMFVRVSDTGDGTGAGLALCRRIVDAHDGRMWLEGHEDGPGLVVRIWIPHTATTMAGDRALVDPAGAEPRRDLRSG